MKFCVIDVSNLVHRVKHGVLKANFNAGPAYFGPRDDEEDDTSAASEKKLKQGMIMDSVFSSIRKGMDRFGADHLVMCFDGRSWRKDFYEDYKRRPGKQKTPKEEADDALVHDVIDSLMDYCRDYTNVTVLHAPNIEADDFIARWVQLHDDPEFSHIIISRDTDFKQLVRDNVELFTPHENVLYTAGGVYYQDGRRPKTGVPVVKMYGETWKVKLDKKGEPVRYDADWELFFKCIRGDTNDNIKSAYPRISEKKMREAFYGDTIAWNNFINGHWGPEENRQSVKERYEFNRTMIDLAAQPDEIVEQMDETIETELDRPAKRMIGVYLNKFCVRYGLETVQAQSVHFTRIFTQRYPLAWDEV